MSDRNQDLQPLSTEEERFVHRVAELYAAPPMTAAQRTRFDARLEERLQNAGARRQPWFAAAAIAAATLALFVWRGTTDTSSGGSGVAQIETPAPIDEAAEDEWILAMATTSQLAASDDDLPADYAAISNLLLGN